MKKREIDLVVKIVLLVVSIAFAAISIYYIITSENTKSKILFAAVLIVALLVDGYLVFCTKGIYKNESNKEYRDKVYIQNKPSYISSDEKFLEVAAIDDIVSKAISCINVTDVSEPELCPICGKEIVRGKGVLTYTTRTWDKSEERYWADEFGNYVRPAYEENSHTNENSDAVRLKCTACDFEMTVGWGKKTEVVYGDYMQMTTRFARINGVKLCQASRSKLEKELKIADKIELMP